MKEKNLLKLQPLPKVLRVQAIRSKQLRNIYMHGPCSALLHACIQFDHWAWSICVMCMYSSISYTVIHQQSFTNSHSPTETITSKFTYMHGPCSALLHAYTHTFWAFKCGWCIPCMSNYIHTYILGLRTFTACNMYATLHNTYVNTGLRTFTACNMYATLHNTYVHTSKVLEYACYAFCKPHTHRQKYKHMHSHTNAHTHAKTHVFLHFSPFGAKFLVAGKLHDLDTLMERFVCAPFAAAMCECERVWIKTYTLVRACVCVCAYTCLCIYVRQGDGEAQAKRFRQSDSMFLV